MFLGIDIVSDVMRAVGSGEHEPFKWEDYGIIGVIPRRNEPFVWNNPIAFRTSIPGPYISMTHTWAKFMLDYRAKCEWYTDEGYLEERLAADLIVEAIGQNIPDSRILNTILAIDNTLPEFQQNRLLRSLGTGGFVNTELLWRPICIALYHLNLEGRDQFNEGERLVIVDTDSYLPELTVLELREHRDELVPLRNLPVKKNPLGNLYSSYKLKRMFVKHVLGNRSEVENQLLNGPYSREFFSFLEGKNHDDIWLREGLSYSKFKVNNEWRSEIRDYPLGEMDFYKLRKTVLDIKDWTYTDHILWNGFPCRIQSPNLFTENETVVDESAVSVGAAEYAYRRKEGKPTYLDTLPGLEILSEVGGTGVRKLFPLIRKGVIEGGQSVRIPKPNKDFALEEGTEIFTSVLRNIAEDSYKKLVTPIPKHSYKGNVPVIIRAEMRPARGYALVTIEGDEDHHDVFGQQRRIELDWESMEDFEFDDYSGPEVYPVRGRISDDPECIAVAREMVNNQLNMSSRVNYKGHWVSYSRLHEPWGYNTPWGERLNEPTRALFGAQIEDDPEINRLAGEIADRIYTTVRSTQDRHKYLNYMFRYAPERFLGELRDIYSSKNPDINFNTVYAVGRTFYRPTDFELFLKFFLDKSKHSGYPAYPKESYTKAYFWSYFRVLCYYEDTIQVPIDMAEKVLLCIDKYITIRSDNNWRSLSYERGHRDVENVIKFLLCAILFSLRFRRAQRNFLEPESDLWSIIVEAIQNKIPRIKYPRTMFETQQPDYLNDYVYRFLANEATEQDFGALKGLTTAIT